MENTIFIFNLKEKISSINLNFIVDKILNSSSKYKLRTPNEWKQIWESENQVIFNINDESNIFASIHLSTLSYYVDFSIDWRDFNNSVKIRRKVLQICLELMNLLGQNNLFMVMKEESQDYGCLYDLVNDDLTVEDILLKLKHSNNIPIGEYGIYDPIPDIGIIKGLTYHNLYCMEE